MRKKPYSTATQSEGRLYACHLWAEPIETLNTGNHMYICLYALLIVLKLVMEELPETIYREENSLIHYRNVYILMKMLRRKPF